MNDNSYYSYIYWKPKSSLIQKFWDSKNPEFRPKTLINITKLKKVDTPDSLEFLKDILDELEIAENNLLLFLRYDTVTAHCKLSNRINHP